MAEKSTDKTTDKTADLSGAQAADQNQPQDATSASQGGVNTSPADPYPDYDLMSLEDLRSLADERGVEIDAELEKAHLVTELRAADSGSVSPTTRKGAR